jgi:hypothetical protein
VYLRTSEVEIEVEVVSVRLCAAASQGVLSMPSMISLDVIKEAQQAAGIVDHLAMCEMVIWMHKRLAQGPAHCRTC